MENKAIRILSFCLIALFALAVIFFAVGILVEYKKAPGIINSTLNQFTSDVGVASEYYTPGSRQFSEVLRARVASNRTIAVVTITKDSTVVFAYPLSSPFITQGSNGQPSITSSSSLVSIKSREILLNDEAYVVTTALYSLQPAVIYSHIRVSFLLILAGTLVAGIALMYLYLTEQKREPYSQTYKDEEMAQRLRSSKLDFPEVSSSQSLDDTDNEEHNLTDVYAHDNLEFDEDNLPEGAMDFPPAEEDDLQPTQELAPQEEVSVNSTEEMEDIAPIQADLPEIEDSDFVVEAPESIEENSEAFLEDEELNQAAVTQAKFSQEEILSRQDNQVSERPAFGIDQALQGFEPPQEETSEGLSDDSHEEFQPDDSEGSIQEIPSEPAGLFSPITGFGWESYLEERLDSELIRSASSEEDIGLMIIRIQGLDRADPRCTAIYEQLLEFYKFRDLIFEYGQDGFSCIVHSINVDGALKLAEEVYVALSKVLESNGMKNEIGIGISTRSFRLIPANRIFMEAEQALLHAFEDSDTAIVAFRVDPEKYRKYISEHTPEKRNK